MNTSNTGTPKRNVTPEELLRKWEPMKFRDRSIKGIWRMYCLRKGLKRI